MENIDLQGIDLQNLVGLSGWLTSKATFDACYKAIGRAIRKARLVDTSGRKEIDAFIVTTDEGALTLWDGGQQCCETRYLTCDDDLDTFVGSTIVGIEVREAPPEEDAGYNVHQTQFLVIRTTLGNISVCTHNVHNGYYGGFSIVARFGDEADPAGIRPYDEDEDEDENEDD